MKNLFLFLALALFVGVGACSDDTTGPGTGAGMTAKVNGQAFNPSSLFTSKAGGRILITGANGVLGTGGTQESIILGFDSVAAGTVVDLGGDSLNIFAPSGEYVKAGVTWETAKNRPSGKITVTEFANGKVKGTFSFTAFKEGNPSDSVVVTDGTFEGTYTN